MSFQAGAGLRGVLLCGHAWELGIKVALGQLSMHHRDPFARMLVAQAQLDVPALVTADRVLSRYGVELVAARS
ncbi:MAG: hypothetical protein WBB59_03150 [Candidatus Microthrix parvicella]|nr:hypothetical protein [Candidatus Microthrix sp.]